MTTQHNDATFFGDTPAFFGDAVTIAFGRNREDKNFRNVSSTFGHLIVDLTKFEIGAKDGRCLLPGEIVAPKEGGRRTAKNVIRNHILMVDIDVGMSLQDIDDTLAEHGLWAMVWTTSSHNKASTDILETRLSKYAQQLGTSVIDEHLVSLYLTREKSIRPACLEGLKITNVGPGDGGKTYTVTHAPIPKYRVMFKLDRPFEFMGVGKTQDEAILEWKERYAGLCTTLNIPFDSSCVDPSRLMYTPRVQKREAFHGIWIFDGAALTLENFARVPVKEARALTRGETGGDAFAAFTELGGSANGDLKTRNLMQFMALHARDFEAAVWLEETAPDDVRTQKGDLIEFRCPNADAHTAGDVSDDKGFAATNASQNDSGNGFGMWCRHDTCIAQSNNDRVFFLDLACRHYGIDDAMVLRKWCPSWLTEENVRTAQVAADKAAEETAKKPDELEASCAALKADSSDADKLTVMEAIARVSLEMTREKYLKIVAKAIGSTVTALKATVKELRNAAEGRAEQAAKDEREREITKDMTPEQLKAREERKNHPVPKDPADAHTIWEDWTADDKRKTAAGRLAAVNERMPRIFVRPEGGVVRVVETDEHFETINENGTKEFGKQRRTTLEPVINKDVWAWELAEAMKFKKVDFMAPDPVTGEPTVKEVDPFHNCVVEVAAGRHRPYPLIEFVSAVPIVVPVWRTATDGKDYIYPLLIKERGYHMESRVYLEPAIKAEALPLGEDGNILIEEHHVDEAIEWLLHEALRDFPFSDAFDGDDQHPIKLHDQFDEVIEQDGTISRYPATNFERGKSSRAHALAMVLQPHLRHFIAGGRPAYHIDKSAPGTGAGFLMDVAYIIAEGIPSVVRPMSTQNEEFRKNITAILRAGEQIIFVDNINHRVDSGELAAALTAGVWSDRVLGESSVVKIPNNAMWVFSGNDVEFSKELNRRLIPIRLDAKEANPIHRKRDMFKHFPLQPWLTKNRAKLLWSVHVLIANWVQKQMPSGSAQMYSFDSYASTMSGVLEAAGIKGFLQTIPAYTKVAVEDDDVPTIVAAKLYETFGATADFSTEQAWMALRAPMGGPNGDVLAYPVPIKAIDQAGKENALGQWIAKRVAKKTFEVKAGVQATCVKHRTAGGNNWRFNPVT